MRFDGTTINRTLYMDLRGSRFTDIRRTAWHGVGNIFADKAYQDRLTVQELEKQCVILYTPDKKRKKTEVYEVGKSSLWSRFVSAIKQPIESFRNWINEQTDSGRDWSE